MAEIQWGSPDSSGALPYALGSLRPDPANRFFDLVPDYSPIGPRVTTLDRTQHLFALREDYTAKLTIRHLQPSQLATALALKAWLIAGGEVAVITDDVDGNEYACTLRPGTTPTITNDDEGRQHFSFSCELAGDDPVVVDYSG